MIRRIVGWTRLPRELWEVTMRRMKLKVAAALGQWDVKPWSARISKNRWLLATKVNSMSMERWAKLCAKWEPATINDPALVKRPSRDRGRPYLRWDDTLTKYCEIHFKKKWHDVLDSSMTPHVQAYCEFVNGVCDSPVLPLIPLPLRNSERNLSRPSVRNIVNVPFASSNDNWW